MKIASTIAAAGMLLLAAAPFQAAAAAASGPSEAPSAAPATAATHTEPIYVGIGRGILLRLPQPAATVMSADPHIARVQPASPTSLFLMGASPGHTTVVATTETGTAIMQYDVTVRGADAAPSHGGGVPAVAGGSAMAAAAQAAIMQFSDGMTTVHVVPDGKNLVLRGTVQTAAAAQQAEAIARGFAGDKGAVVDDLSVLGQIQVNVRVRIAEIDRNITRQLGFNWQALGRGTPWQFGVLTGTAALGGISPLLPLGLTPLSGASAVPYQVGLGYQSGNTSIDGVIDALAADQLITILAEPNLTVQSGEPASFLAGGEFPIPVAGNTVNGSTTISVEFKKFGVSLNVVPTVLSSTQVNLRVSPEVSQLSNMGAVSVPVAGGVMTIPALTVRRAETTVELGSGQSFAIAGLLQKTSTDQTNALPGIGEVPVLGALFKSNDFQRGDSELVIIVTPYIVRPVSNPNALRAPTDNFKPATDLDRILFGRQMAPVTASNSLDAGFILK